MKDKPIKMFDMSGMVVVKQLLTTNEPYWSVHTDVTGPAIAVINIHDDGTYYWKWVALDEDDALGIRKGEYNVNTLRQCVTNIAKDWKTKSFEPTVMPAYCKEQLDRLLNDLSKTKEAKNDSKIRDAINLLLRLLRG